MLDDGDAFKVGHTTTDVALRIQGLQTGNPRTLRPVATIAYASDGVEAELHKALEPWHVSGEWYAREPIRQNVERAGGWEPYLRSLLAPDNWNITIYDSDNA